MLDYVWTHGREVGKSFPYKDDALQCRLCGINFGQDKDQQQTHFNFHRKQSIIFFKRSGIEEIEVDGTEEELGKLEVTDVELESTHLIQLRYAQVFWLFVLSSYYNILQKRENREFEDDIQKYNTKVFSVGDGSEQQCSQHTIDGCIPVQR